MLKTVTTKATKIKQTARSILQLLGRFRSLNSKVVLALQMWL